mmetsp:Transcript_16009/g.24233  ORF Transcript_16009/g.24233 Transcript_16009/m.24233 type:complete len:88 (+) Transcript_16009:131-394(+)
MHLVNRRMNRSISISFDDGERKCFTYPGVAGHEILQAYYQEADYRHFRQEAWLEKMRKPKISAEMNEKHAKEANEYQNIRESAAQAA